MSTTTNETTQENPRSITSRITNLKERIKGSNNGYIFAPTPEEVYVAMKYYQIFDLQFYALNEHVPILIFLRKN